MENLDVNKLALMSVAVPVEVILGADFCKQRHKKLCHP